MLTEIKSIRQIEGEPHRRWFTSGAMDLTVWYANHMIIGFQLCYDKHHHEKAFTWKQSGGHRHQSVDDGESVDFSYKATPLLLESEPVDSDYILEKFNQENAELDKHVRDIIMYVLGAANTNNPA